MKNISRILFFVIIVELILGGGGRLTAFGPVTLRMILFAAAMLLTVVYFIQGRRLPSVFSYFLAAFIASMFFAAIIGIVSGAEMTLLFEDVKPLAYVLILPFFVFIIEDTTVVRRVPSLIISGAAILAVTFFVILVMIHTELVSFLSFYDLVIPTGEFFFRAETTFFYKGFIYVCIALIFAFFIQRKHKVIMMLLLATAIILTFTRGFLFALTLTYLLYAVLEKKFIHASVTLMFAIIVVFFSKPIIYGASILLHEVKGLDERVPKEQLLGNRDASDAGRFMQASEVLAKITPLSFAVGHGFGNGVPSRPVHMEISYLEIFHKQGVVGLGVWAYLLYLLLAAYRAAVRDAVSKAFFFSALFIFLQSITNQFVNNPIGLSFVLLSLTYLHSRQSSKDIVGSPLPRHQKGDGIASTSF
ncbi:MAG TPA: hypothetical protein VGD40_09290 [Chryseosolibacter sp.]